MILIILLITITYLFLIGRLTFGFNKVPIFSLEDLPSITKFSIVIPFRNEAEPLPELLASIETLNYPKQLFEIILVDDDSQDNSVDIINSFLIKHQLKQHNQIDISIISNTRKTNSPKKDAITCAIKKAKYDWIITTDADCKLPQFWLDSFDEYIQKYDAVCIAAPVTYNNNTSFLKRFQTLDLLSLQGATIGGFGINKPFLCNGANFAYKKSVFNKINGFQGNTNIASGDDIFLLEKIKTWHPKKLHYLKCEKAIVSTKPQTSWKLLIAQRVRWAAKTSAYNNWFGKFTGLIVLLMNAIIIICLVLSLIQIFNFKTLFYILVIKFSIDFFLIYTSASFFNQKNILKIYILGFLIYPIFSVYIALLSSFSGYQWKGRKFTK